MTLSLYLIGLSEAICGRTSRAAGFVPHDASGEKSRTIATSRCSEKRLRLAHHEERSSGDDRDFRRVILRSLADDSYSLEWAESAQQWRTLSSR